MARYNATRGKQTSPNYHGTNYPLGNRGQLSIFFGMTLVILMTVIAFVVNVGIFVKAKINLQNAVDAAAWSGAAVQARQLTNIAYLNWEMRNTFKEWMFKYYVLGQISHPNVKNPSGTYMDFRLRNFEDNPNIADTDEWNIPSICINFQGAGAANICAIYSVPGLPRHETQGAPGLDEQYNTFLNQIVKAKAKDCSERSNFNFATAMMWAYGTGVEGESILTNAPQIAAQRKGAWVEALEYAVRMRNLEYIVNQTPKTNICIGGDGCTPVDSLQAGENDPPLDERTVKAFWSAYRNLGNSDPRGPNELKSSFKLTELSPSPYTVTGMSTALINSDRGKIKPYLDLQLYMLNLVTFYNTFSTVTGENAANNIPDHAKCPVSKTALPVPGYPLGFVKNPEVLTYYAVKGEAEFNGLLNPFSSRIKMQAYAAAKPFGGRIGPQLFQIKNGAVYARINRSFPYLSGLSVPNSAYKPGLPIPHIADFWVESDDDPIGGLPGQTENIKFAIPNLIVDLIGGNVSTGQEGGSERIVKVESNPNTSLGDPTGPFEIGGLYDKDQFLELYKKLTAVGSNGVGFLDRDEVDKAITIARAPTKYEAMNYLIPTLGTANENREGNIESPTPFVREQRDGRIHYRMYAPLVQSGLLYQNVSDIQGVIEEHINGSEPSIRKYLTSLGSVAKSIIEADQAGAQQLYLDAAKLIHDGIDSNNNILQNPTCKSMAGQFRYFFLGEEDAFGPGCRIKLKDSVKTAWEKLLSLGDGGTNFATHINPTFGISEQLGTESITTPNQAKTAYSPGPRQGATLDAQVENPFIPEQKYDAHRNFYSTKFIALHQLRPGAVSTPYIGGSFSSYSEGGPNSPVEIQDTSFLNALNPLGELGALEQIFH